jgi:serine/threonine-protein kinase HipA
VGRPRLTAHLGVFMNGEEVGRLTSASTGQLQFVYANNWLQSELSRPISLSLPLTSQVYRGSVVENYFENLLPDNQSIKNRIQARFKAKSNNSFDLLWHVGRDCVGAIQLLPEGHSPGTIQSVHAVPLTNSQIADMIHNYKSAPLGMSDDDEDFRISIAGAQEKTALLKQGDRWYKPLGSTPTSHIFKLPIGQIHNGRIDMADSVENEWLCHLIFKAYSIPTADAEIGVFDDTKALIVKRFDRRWSTDGSWLIRLPQEDMCQSMNIPSALKHENHGGPGIVDIMSLLGKSENPFTDRYLFFKTQLLFWLMAAIDGHAKNFSVFLLRGGSYRLTPVYDVLSAHHLAVNGQILPQKLKMAMAVRGKSKHFHWERILPRHWYTTGSLCRFQSEQVDKIIDELIGSLEATIEQVGSQLPADFPARVYEPLFEGMLSARDLFVAGDSR